MAYLYVYNIGIGLLTDWLVFNVTTALAMFNHLHDYPLSSTSICLHERVWYGTRLNHIRCFFISLGFFFQSSVNPTRSRHNGIDTRHQKTEAKLKWFAEHNMDIIELHCSTWWKLTTVPKFSRPACVRKFNFVLVIPCFSSPLVIHHTIRSLLSESSRPAGNTDSPLYADSPLKRKRIEDAIIDDTGSFSFPSNGLP